MAYEVENFALLNENVESIHDLFDRGGVVPPMHVKEVDIARAQLFERSFNRNMH